MKPLDQKGSKGSGYRILSAFINVWYLSASLEGEAPQWMTKGRTVLIWKDKSKGNEASNYRPLHVSY